jgi:hypothetical protein
MRLAALALVLPLLVCAAACCTSRTASERAPTPVTTPASQSAQPTSDDKPTAVVTQPGHKAAGITTPTVTAKPEEGAKAPKPPPPPPPTVHTEYRAGAVILEAKWPSGLTVSYEPDRSLTWPTLAKALAGRPAQTTLRPFAALATKLPPNAVSVPNGDQILGRALARQLQALGWKVSLVGFTRDMPKPPGEARAEAKEAASQPVTFEIGGKGSFAGVYDQARAVIDAEVTFGRGEGALRVVVHVDQSVPGEAAASDRLAKARQMVLAAFVRAIFEDRRVEPALIKRAKVR